MTKRKILIDLDGVLNEYEGKFNENEIPPIKLGAKSFLSQLSKKAELYLFTARDKALAKKWLIQNEIDKYFKDVTNVKIPAYLYIDDRTICFNGDYDILLEKIKSFKTYWQ